MNSMLTDADRVETGIGENRDLMTELSITRHGRYYHFDGYRYELLGDAIAYAELIRARSSQPVQRPHLPAFDRFDAVAGPSAADWQVMQDFSISFENHSYVFEGYHYDRLIDAANYARHRRASGSKAP